MKTFKLISLQIVEDSGLLDIPLDDGLIINKEDERNTWIMEAYVSKIFAPFFEGACKEHKEIIAQVVITKKDNDPAAFLTKVCSVKQLKDHVSILLEGVLKKTKSNYAEQLLEHLIGQGLTGDDLLTEFKKQIESKPRIPAKNV